MKLIEKFSDFIARQEWVNAKSYEALAPHEYICKYNLDKNDKTIFDEFVFYIRNNGYRMKFAGHRYIYFNIGNYKYWTMGNRIEDTFILNRAIIKDGKIDEYSED